MSLRTDIIQAVKTLLATIPNTIVSIKEHQPMPEGQNILAVEFPDGTNRYIQLTWSASENTPADQKGTNNQVWDGELEVYGFTRVATTADEDRVTAAEDFQEEIAAKIGSDPTLVATNPALSGSVMWMHIDRVNVVQLAADDKPYGGRMMPVKVQYYGI